MRKPSARVVHMSMLPNAAAALRVVLALVSLAACVDPGVVGGVCDAAACEPGRQHIDAAAALPDAELGCIPEHVQLERKRLDMYMLVDDSTSMVPWWQDSLEGIDAFLTDPHSAG